MPTTIKLKNSVTTTNAPTSLVQGEVAINITDKKVWVGDAATTPIQLLGAGASASFSALSCTTLSASGVATFSAGTVSAPAITTSGDTNTGIFFPAADTIAFTEGGVEAMRIDSSGRLLLGTSTPGATTSGTITSYSNTTSAVILQNSNSGTGNTVGFQIALENADAYVFNKSNGPLIFGSNDIERMRISSTGNVGIGTTPSYRLHVSGNTASHIIQYNYNGGSGRSQLAFQDTATTFSPSLGSVGDAITVFTAGNERMRIDSSGNVGIGTSSPTTKLDVNGDAKLGNTVDIGLADANNTIVNVGLGATGNRFAITDYIGDTTYTDFGLRVGRVNDGANGTSRIQHRGTGGLDIGAFDAGFVRFLTSNTERMRIDSSGNVGIGTTSPDTKLQTSGTGSTSISARSNTSGDSSFRTYLDSNLASHWYSDRTNSKTNFGTVTSTPLVFETNNTERMRITSGGFVKASNNATYSDASGNYHELNSTTNNDNVLYVRNTSSSPYGIINRFPSATPNNTTNYFFLCDDSTNQKFIVYSNGTAQNRTGTYTTISDLKLKENVVDATSKLDKLNQVRVVNYNLIGDDLKQIGFVAQELEQVFPSLVFETPDLDENKQPTGESTKGVKLTVMIPILVKAVQELNAKVEAQAAEIALLKSK